MNDMSDYAHTTTQHLLESVAKKNDGSIADDYRALTIMWAPHYHPYWRSSRPCAPPLNGRFYMHS